MKYEIDFIAGNSIYDCYYQLVRVADNAILCAYRTIDEVWAYAREAGINGLTYEL